MVLDLLINTLGQPRNGTYKGKTKFDFNCPKCRDENQGVFDNKYNMGILIDGNRNFCNCWKCGYKPQIKWLLERYGTPDDYKLYCDYNLDNFKVEVKNNYYVFYSFPKGYIPFDKFDLNDENHKKAYEYLTKERSLSKKTINFFKIGACFEGKYQNRIIIPSFDEFNNINFFIARSFTNESPTYLHEFVDKSSFICNESNINWNHPVTLVEGYMDMASLPINCIPLIGKILLPNLLKKLYTNKCKVILILDEGEDKTIKKIEQQLSLFNIETKIVKLKPQTKDLNNILTKIGKGYIEKEVLNYVYV